MPRFCKYYMINVIKFPRWAKIPALGQNTFTTLGFLVLFLWDSTRDFFKDFFDDFFKDSTKDPSPIPLWIPPVKLSGMSLDIIICGFVQGFRLIFPVIRQKPFSRIFFRIFFKEFSPKILDSFISRTVKNKFLNIKKKKWFDLISGISPKSFWMNLKRKVQMYLRSTGKNFCRNL